MTYHPSGRTSLLVSISNEIQARERETITMLLHTTMQTMIWAHNKISATMPAVRNHDESKTAKLNTQSKQEPNALTN